MSAPAAPTALPIVLKDMPLTDIATLHRVVVRMIDVASSGRHERSFASVVDRINGIAVSTWTLQDAILRTHHDVRCFEAVTDLEALHLLLTEEGIRTTLAEPRRRDRTNFVGRADDPTSAVLSTLAALRASLEAASGDADGWMRPKLQNCHIHERSLGQAFAASIPDHVEATFSLAGQETGMFVNIVMPSPYGHAKYGGSEVFARNPKGFARIVARTSILLPECIMVARKGDHGPTRREWEVSPYRTGLEMIEAKGDVMQRLRALARVERDGPKG